MNFAYADPPYIGQAKKHYAKEAAADGRVAAEVDHRMLVAQLAADYPDGWALSLSTPSVEEILGICRDVLGPNRVRIGSWVKPFAVYKPNVNPGYCWEPVLFCGGRKRGRELPTLRDWVSCNITLRRGMVGAKPEAVCHWIFEMLGASRATDTLADLFPGSGAVARAWETYAGPVPQKPRKAVA